MPFRSDKFLKAGLEWQANARRYGVLSNWTRDLHRGGERGILEFGGSPERRASVRRSSSINNTSPTKQEFVVRNNEGKIDYK